MQGEGGLSFEETLIVAGLTSVVGGLLAAVVTSILAGWRFRSEKWWERRSAAYEQTAAALHQQKLAAIEAIRRAGTWSEEEGGPKRLPPPLPEDLAISLREAAKQASREIERRIAEGQLLLSKEAINLLESYEQAAEDAIYEDETGGNPGRDHRLKVVTRAHEEFIEQAKIDLGLPEGLGLALRRPIRSLKRWQALAGSQLHQQWQTESYLSSRRKGVLGLGAPSWSPPYEWDYRRLFLPPR